MADRTPYISWPGVAQPASCSYTLSQGISPGTALLTLLPQDVNQIALQGDLTLGDGVGKVTLRNCKVQRIRSTLDPISGETWTMEIQDRRWRWQATGYVNGTYNVPDDSRDVTRPPEGAGPYLAGARIYVPWTVRSPHDLIRQCLDAMGEKDYRIDAPNVAYPLPAIQWDFVNAAQALSRLCDTLGVRVVYRPDTDTVWIVPIGKGAGLPDGGPGVLYRDAPGIKTPSRPDSIILVGGPVKYQVEWVLEAVGEEWDGSLKPIDALSYAPPQQFSRHNVKLTPASLADASVLTFVIEYDESTWTMQHTMSGTTVSSATAGLTAEINGLMGAFGFQATDNTTHVTVLGPPKGERFTVRTSATGGSKVIWELIEQGQRLASRWANEFPQGGFQLGRTLEEFEGNIQLQRLTNRLTYTEAVALANKSVFRYYRIVNVNISTGKGPAEIPEYGKLDTTGGIFRVILLNEQLEQTLPVKEDELIFRPGDGLPITRDFYNGLFKQKPARCYGRYYRALTGLWKNPADMTDVLSDPEDEVLVDFSIVPNRSLIVFSEPVYLGGDALGNRPADIRLRCACNLRDGKTNHVVRFTHQYDFPGPRLGTKPAVIHHGDIERLIRQTYQVFDDDNADPGYRIEPGTVLKNDGEVAVRALYYLEKAALKYQTPLSGERQYNGIIPVFCDGAIMQVSWNINIGGGAETAASLNFEHAIYTPQYPERLRIEYMRNIVEAGEPKPNVQDMMTPPGKSGGGPGGIGKGGYAPSGGGWS